MKKKAYIYPRTEVTVLMGLRLMGLGDPSNKASYAPPQRKDPAF